MSVLKTIWLRGFTEGVWPTTFEDLLGEWRRVTPLDQQTQKDRDAAVRRLEIFPGHAFLRAGEAVRFNATPYDGDNLPVGGVQFTWEAYDETSKEAVGIEADGLFKAPSAGKYRVVLKGAGRTVEAAASVTGAASDSPPSRRPSSGGLRASAPPHPRRVTRASTR